jgi:hypothetical protein
VKTKELLNDGRRRVYLVRMEPGAKMPGHSHEGHEECMVLRGEVWLGEFLIRAGDFHFWHPGDCPMAMYAPIRACCSIGQSWRRARLKRATTLFVGLTNHKRKREYEAK